MRTLKFDKYCIVFLVVGLLVGSLIVYNVLDSRYGSQIWNLEQVIDTQDSEIEALKAEVAYLNHSLIEATQKNQGFDVSTDLLFDSVTVVFETSMGDIVFELYPEVAPVSVENFVDYVRAGFFDGLVFHRVISGFMVQGGGFFENGSYREPIMDAIVCESNNGLSNVRGSVAMARSSVPNSATSQFFVNVVDNPSLDYPSYDGYGYAVFGKVVEGMDVVDEISNLETESKVTPYGTVENWPIEDVTVLFAYLRE